MSQSSGALVNEELAVLFHAALLGRADVAQNAISAIRSTSKETDQTAKIISSGRPEDDATPLHVASKAGHSDVVRTLLNAGADLSVVPTKDGDFTNKTPYEVAADQSRQAFHVYLFEQIAMGRTDVIQRLLSGGVPVSATDGSKLNDSTVHWAVHFGNIDVAKLLLTFGIDVNVRNADEETPLHVACKGLSVELVKLLLSEGASTTVLDMLGRTPLQQLPKPNEDIEKLLADPPAPTYELRNQFIAAQEAVAAAAVVAAGTAAGATEVAKAKEEEEPAAEGFITPTITPAPEAKNSPIATASSLPATTELPHEHFISAVESSAGSVFDEVLSVSATGTAATVGTVGTALGMPSHHYDFDDELFDGDDPMGDIEGGGGSGGGGSGYEDSSKEPVLVLWPPAQRQIRRGSQPLVFSSDEPIIISVPNADEHVFQLLTWSGIITAVERFNLMTVVDKIAPESHMRVCIDPHVCPGRHRFEVNISPEQAVLTGSDATGLLYALHAFLQLLQLHSDVQYHGQRGTTISIPAIIIRDWPDVPDRAVMWAYKESCRTSFKIMRENVELLSKLRINMLNLVIDVTEGASIELNESSSASSVLGFSDSSNAAAGDVLAPSAAALAESTESKIGMLDELCQRLCVDLIPTIILTSVSQRIPLNLLKNFRQPLVSIGFLYDLATTASEIANTNGGDLITATLTAEHACRYTCERILSVLRDAGYTSVIIASSDWTTRTANPCSVAVAMGLNIVERSLSQLYPSSLFVKPVVCVPEFIKTLNRHSQRVLEEGMSVSMFPAFMPSDFMYPALLLKFFEFYHGGFAWNRAAVVDMLHVGDEGGDAVILKEVATLLLFSPREEQQLFGGATVSSSPSKSKQTSWKHTPPSVSEQYATILDLFTGELFRTEFSPGENHAAASGSGITTANGGISSVFSASASGTTTTANVDDVGPPSNFGDVERRLWSLLNSQVPLRDAELPSKTDASTCLRYYRRLLNIAKWKMTSPKASGLFLDFVGLGSGKPIVPESPYDLDIDEFFSVVQTLSILCRAIVLAYNARDKVTSSSSTASGKDPSHPSPSRPLHPAIRGAAAAVTFGSLLSTLPLGTKSDIANALLEVLGYYSFLAKRRYDKIVPRFVPQPTDRMSVLYRQLGIIVTGPASHVSAVAIDSVKLSRLSFLLQSAPGLPSVTVFKTISDQLPITYTAEEVIGNLFA